MDISETTAPKSDQQNFDDYATGPRTVTISEVRAGSTEQPVEIHLVEFPGRPYKPSKSMRRVLIAAWGPEAKVYAGRRMTLVGDPTVKFGGAVVGGIKIGALSHIDKRLTVNLTVTKNKRAPHTVEPLADQAPKVTNPNAGILTEIGAMADELPGGRAAVAAQWAEAHGGESLRDATDVAALQHLRDELTERLAK
jgi:hypothetical protein